MTIGFLELPPSMVANTESIVLGMKAGFLACYRRGLASNPAMKGFVRIGVEIGRFGEVVQAEAKEGDGLSPELTSCLVRRVRSASFAPPDPEGSRASLRLSIGLQPTDE